MLRERGHAAAHRIRPEVARYFGWPAQAISYKLGERAWLMARQAASRRTGFDLRTWHTTAVGLGPVGLDDLVDALKDVGRGAAGQCRTWVRQPSVATGTCCSVSPS
ncbi:DUF885 family protein [Nonomuraea sp. NPDC004580]|uniref:DUF885 family protein n=1 Tax=Nonomuraea sp. NPDC004580 TaxID=3154552 RepID=UPI0033A91343